MKKKMMRQLVAQKMAILGFAVAVVMACAGLYLLAYGSAQRKDSDGGSSGGGKPSDVVNLKNWYLGLPTGSGKAGSVKQPKLNSYSSEFFRLNEAGDAVVLKAPVKGSKTANSKHTRTELREADSKGKIPYGWNAGSGSHSMEATMSITHLPNKKGIISFAQIHGQGSKWYLILNATGNGDGTAKLATKDETGKANKKVIDPKYKLGEKFDIKIAVVNGKVTISYNGKPKVTTTSKLSGSYFKIGTYNQSGGDYGETELYDVKVKHSK